MNFYLDLEATQFSTEILSIGAVSETGKEFYTLVRLPDPSNVTKLITSMTGITREDAGDSSNPYISEAISMFWNWMKVQSDSISIFTFGTFDIDLLNKAYIRKSTKELKSILDRVYDVSNVLSILGSGSYTCKLLTLYKGVKGTTTVEQKHNALEDAVYLKEVHEYYKGSAKIKVRSTVERKYMGKYMKKLNQSVISGHVSNERLDFYNTYYKTEKLTYAIFVEHIGKNTGTDKAIDKEIERLYNSLLGLK